MDGCAGGGAAGRAAGRMDGWMVEIIIYTSVVIYGVFFNIIIHLSEGEFPACGGCFSNSPVYTFRL